MKDRIRQLRKSLNLTQQEFADRIGSDRVNIAQYERGRNAPSKMAITAICREFNVNEEWLKNGTGEMYAISDRKDELKKFFDETLADEPDSFRSSLVSALAVLDRKHWDTLADIADLILLKQSQSASSKNTNVNEEKDSLDNLPTSKEMDEIVKHNTSQKSFPNDTSSLNDSET